MRYTHEYPSKSREGRGRDTDRFTIDMKVVRINQFIFCVRKHDFAISLGVESGEEEGG